MQVQVNTDHNIHGGEKLAGHIQSEVESALARFRDRLTRVEVHLAHEGAAGEDKRCVMEARAAGSSPVAVTHHAGTVDDAYTGAAHKLGKLLDSKYGREGHHKGAESIRHMEPAIEDLL